ncbi:MAG TPA: aromatic ring-hydroxylating dioxygenase subunit alpha [Burkholderiales bacterium]|nr:aromatic ring-hydroxylating dioxygenase subunit alpha [Burkholderiales bacterium]
MLTRVQKPWPQNAWYQAAWSSELKQQPLGRTFLNEPVVLFRDASGKACALEDRCCHRATPLRLGEVVPEGLQCGYHGMVFDGSGKCVRIPGQDSIPPQAKVRSYPVVERQEFVWIWMGDPALADESKLIDYPWNDDHVNWPHLHGMNYVKCDFMLLMDNLMDLTHIPHIHRKTIGGGSVMEQVNARMDVKRTDAGVHYIRWMFGITPPPTYVKGAGFAPGVKVDRWQEFEYIAPASVIQWTGALETGRGAEQNRNQKGGFSLRLYHGATPETETSCYYFWTPANGYKPEDAAATKVLYEEIASTFLEDVAVLEAQQARLSAAPDRPLVDLKHDIARLPARRALERMIRAETAVG